MRRVQPTGDLDMRKFVFRVQAGGNAPKARVRRVMQLVEHMKEARMNMYVHILVIVW